MDAPRIRTLDPRIWIDLATPPQALFFRPLVDELTRRGAKVSVSVRNFGMTVPLARQLGYSHEVIGGDTGKRPILKLAATLRRAGQMLWWAKSRGPFDLAVSYNSYAQAVAAFASRIPFVTLMDYEHQPANRWCFRLADRIIVPEAFDANAMKPSIQRKLIRHPGLKEHVYLQSWNVDPVAARTSLALGEHEQYVLVRTPADYALYHQFANELFDNLLASLIEKSGVAVVVVPRTSSQREAVVRRFESNPRIIVLSQSIDGPSLISGALAVVSAGGTMAREAAVLGIPAFSIFAGVRPGVDRWLEEVGRLRHLASLEDIDNINWHELVNSAPGRLRTRWREQRALGEITSALWDSLRLRVSG